MNDEALRQLIQQITGGGVGNVSNQEQAMFSNTANALSGQGNNYIKEVMGMRNNAPTGGVGNVSNNEQARFQEAQRNSYMNEVMGMRNNAPAGGVGNMSQSELLQFISNPSQTMLAENTPNPNNTLTPNNAQGSSSQSDMKNYVNHLMATFNSTVDPATRNAIQTELNNFGIPPEYYTAPQGAR